ncbi:MAG: patatin-like phospholipase family protein [Bacteroides sp.]|nr:patatin-like phospholipase family protein [Bacteroides sp.]
MRSFHLFAFLFALVFGVAQGRSERFFNPDVVDSLKFSPGRPQSVGLVLSGGGAKGIAHIGVIQALEDHNIPIDYIAGTSMGAIVGGLYAAGYTPAEMMELIESEGFAHWSTGEIDKSLTYYYAQPEPTPAFINVNFGDSTSSFKSILPTSFISPLPMNFAFMALFSAYTAQCDENFDNLFVPFRCVTSDVYTKRKVVCSKGSLGDAIRASMTFPIVFRPIEMDGTLMYDGGIYDNFPVDVMRTEFAPDIMIGVNVSGADGKPESNDLFQQIEDMIIQNNDYSLPAEEGIKIKVDVSNFGLLDFGKAREIYKVGYDRAMQFMDSVCGRVTSRVAPVTRSTRRQVFKDNSPYVHFDSVVARGGTKAQNDYLRYLFTYNSPDTFGIARARDSYYRAITSGQLQNLVPHAIVQPGDSMFTLDLKATVNNSYRLGVGGYISSSTSSMLFFSGGYNAMNFNSLDASVNAWVGQNYMAAMGDLNFTMLTHIPSYIDLKAVISRQKYHENDVMFYSSNVPTFVTSSEAFVRGSYGIAAGRRGKIALSLGYGHLTDHYFQSSVYDFRDQSRDETVRDYAEVVASYERSTLNDRFYPTDGSFCNVSAYGVYGNYSYRPADPASFAPDHRHPLFTQVEVTAKGFMPVSRHFGLGGELDMLLSTRKLLSNYTATIIDAPSFRPTPSCYNSFNTGFRANSWVAPGIVPVWKISQMFQVRGNFHAFVPLRKIEEGENHSAHYGRWFANPEFFGEVAAVLSLPFASVTAYGNYQTSPAHTWNCGISFGIFLQAPKFLR